MKVLFVCPFVPWPLNSGGRIRTHHLIRAQRGHAEVHLRCLVQPGEDEAALEAVAPACATVRAFPLSPPGRLARWSRSKLERWFHSTALREALARELADGRWDVVHLDELLLARGVPPGAGVPVLQHHHKIDTVLYARLSEHRGAHRHFDLWKLRRLERYAALRYRHHVVCSEEDAAFLRARYPDVVYHPVPSGFDPEHFRPAADPPPRERGRLLFVGSLDYGPNVDAVVRFAREILPAIRAKRPEASLWIVGASPVPEVSALASPFVEVHPDVPDVRPWLERASAFVVPLRIGGGTRLKIVEALAMECPVVSTEIGAEGLGLSDGEHLYLARDSDAFASRALEALADPATARATARRGRRVANARFRWDVLAERLRAAWAAAAERA